MSIEDNKALARRFYETQDSTGGMIDVDAFIAPTASFYMAGSPPLNREQMQGMLGFFYGAFSGLHHTIEDQMAEGDKVMSRITLHGNHTGAFQGIPPTGIAIALEEIVIDRFAEGKVVEHWASVDMLGLLQQLGAIPRPA
jgi:SnoaL-like polyketide cyclase